MRIISGNFKGIKLKGDNLEGTRPTQDRVKESLFAMIQEKVMGSICLDLFAGSGSLGLEALSNGASFVYFVDYKKEAIKVINDNILKCGVVSKCRVLNLDYKKALERFKNNGIKFDLIFLDPPYNLKIADLLIKELLTLNLLKEDAIIVLEYQLDELEDEYDNLSLIKFKKYGDKYIKIYSNTLMENE